MVTPDVGFAGGATQQIRRLGIADVVGSGAVVAHRLHRAAEERRDEPDAAAISPDTGSDTAKDSHGPSRPGPLEDGSPLATSGFGVPWRLGFDPPRHRLER